MMAVYDVFYFYSQQQKLRIFCICPITLQQVGKGYVLKKPRAWLVKVAPVLQLCLGIVKIAVQAYGIPLPIPRIVDGSLDSTLNKLACLDELSRALHDTVSDAVKDGAVDDAVLDAVDDVQGHLSSLTDDGVSDRLVKRAGRKLLQDTTSAYNDMFKLLLLLEEKATVAPHPDWKPQHTGLLRQVSAFDSSVAWVSPGQVGVFHQQGKLALHSHSQSQSQSQASSK